MKKMNVFKENMVDQAKAETSCGNPLRDPSAIERRLTHFAQMTGGNGFRIPAKSSNGKRAEKQAKAHERAMRQFRKEREIGTNPRFHHGSYVNPTAVYERWDKASKAWDAANA
jgi:hypothetical protein